MAGIRWRGSLAWFAGAKHGNSITDEWRAIMPRFQEKWRWKI